MSFDIVIIIPIVQYKSSSYYFSENVSPKPLYRRHWHTHRNRLLT